MPGLIDVINVRFIQPYQYIILVTVLVVIFIIASYYAYNWYYITTMEIINDPVNDIANGEMRNKELTIQIFTVDWCPHCKTAKPEWATFCQEYNGKVINGYSITCDATGTDLTNENDANNAYLIKTYSIESYPTVILMKDNKRYDFDAKISRNTLSQFVDSVASD
jgi:thiol-disulfide isomerase/thioredoxin